MSNLSAALHHHKLGHGPKILLAFHGIGQDGAGCFKPWEEHLGHYYTIYAFDLFFHGKNAAIQSDALFSEPEVITKDIWTGLLADFISAHGIGRFDIAGFSMGGKFALATLEAFASQTDRVFLIAPDGISEHPLYTLAARIALTRRLFRWCMKHPDTFLNTARALQKMGLVNASLVRFTQHVLETPQKRGVVYNSWIAFRDLRFNIPQLHTIAKKNGTEIYLLVGKHDKLLKPSAVKKLSDLLPESHYLTLTSGHSSLMTKAAETLSGQLPPNKSLPSI